MTCQYCTPGPAPSGVELSTATAALTAASEEERAALALYDHDHDDEAYRRLRNAVLATDRARRAVGRLERAMREEVAG